MNQAVLFQSLCGRLLYNSWRALVGQSSMRPLTILLCSLVVWLFVFSISWGGFLFLQSDIEVPLTGEIVGILLDLLFLSLAVLLIFSSGLILYGSLFTSAETAFLLSRPVAADQVFAYKFQGAVAFSSWAFLLLGTPVLIAYGLVGGAPWYFYVLLPLFFLGFVLLPGSLGALAALLIVNFVPQRRKQVLALLLAGLVLALAAWLYRMVNATSSDMWRDETREAVTRLLSYFHFTRNPLAPSHWVSLGLRRILRGELGLSLYYLALVWANGLFLYLLAAAASVTLYRRGYNRLQTGGEFQASAAALAPRVRLLTRLLTRLAKRFSRGADATPLAVRREAWMDRLLYAVLPFVHPSTRLLLVKDFRTFRRDPQQWGQILAFSGLMMLYFMNIRRFVENLAERYQSTISFLNLCAVALLLCTYTGRFVYPMLSLEGRKFWILGLLPLKRDHLLWGKFAFSMTGGLLIAEALVLVSDLMLLMPATAIVLHLLTVLVLAAGLSGLSVGLGACMPNFRETDPSKIAAGFGGTLNLVASLLFLLLVLGLMAAPWHLQWLPHTILSVPSEESGPSDTIGLLSGTGVVLGVIVGLASVVLPLRAGIRALRDMEF